ncbi:MAG: hypothetical protein EOP06_20540 [Proteobacteria bacterium]|nr:MAG: hypothetical protein EOP06_20540 [Pseudomonadota bacterium]
MIRYFVLLTLLISSSAFAKASLCGSVDYRTVENGSLESLVRMSDIQSGHVNIVRGQCGLPGEQIRICSSCTNSISTPALNSIRSLVGTPEHLDWHMKWHNIRRLATQLSTSQYAQLVSLNRVPVGQSKADFISTHGVGGTGAGEDFIFMHRMMIKMVQTQLATDGLPCVAPWKDLPLSLDDRIWPVPKVAENPASRDEEQVRFDRIKTVLKKLQDPIYARSVSLNEFGNRIETSVHQSLHDFYRSSLACTGKSLADKTCDDLVPVASSPMNKHFWKIHGLVDQLLGKWLEANNYREISLDCGNRASCYQWKAPWVEPYPK